jgi:hypothetical protein
VAAAEAALPLAKLPEPPAGLVVELFAEPVPHPASMAAATAVPIVNRIARMCWFSCRFVMERWV